MSIDSHTNNRSSSVVYNSIILYARMIVTMGLSLISTKVALQALGTVDYGIFNLIAGIIGMLALLSVTMTVGTQRYLSYYNGSGDFKGQVKIFQQSWLMHILIGFAASAFLLSLLPLLFNGFLNIEAGKGGVAKSIFVMMSFSVFFTILAVPFIAVITSHENMVVLGIVSVLEAILKLVAAYSIFIFEDHQKLHFYGILMACISLFSFICYVIYCLKRYPECSLKLSKVDFRVMRSLGSFTGWNLLGSTARLGRIQGLSVILNIFYGTTINSSFGIANQVSGTLNFLSANLVRALNPQIMKSEGAGNTSRVIRLSLLASKFGYLILAAVSIPIIFEIDDLLKLWLGLEIPYVSSFSIILILSILIEQVTIGLLSALQSVGKVQQLHIGVSFFWLLSLPLAYFLLAAGYPVYYAVFTTIVTEFCASVYRMYLSKKLLDIAYGYYFNKVILKILLPSVISIIFCYGMVNSVDFEYRFLITIPFSILFFVITLSLYSLEDNERKLLREVFYRLKGKSFMIK